MTSMLARKYLGIIAHYEWCLRTYGDQHLGVDWSSARDAETRYRVMLDLIRAPAPQRVSLLDFGCGASHLLDFIIREKIESLEYTGLDLSSAFIALSRQKYPHVREPQRSRATTETPPDHSDFTQLFAACTRVG